MIHVWEKFRILKMTLFQFTSVYFNRFGHAPQEVGMDFELECHEDEFTEMQSNFNGQFD